MREPRPVTLALLALLAASPVLLPLGKPPVVTALAELWMLAVSGVVAVVLGRQSWREAPLQVAAFESPDARRSTWPMLLVMAAAIAGLMSAFIGVVQVMVPEALHSGAGGLGLLIQASHLDGRAVGHLRQPNHLATVLLWGAAAWGVLQAQARVPTGAALAGWLMLMTALVFTGSRTGLLGVLLLLAWAGFDRRLPRLTRLFLALTPLMAAAVWVAMRAWSAHSGVELGSAQHLAGSGGGDVSSSRFAIWRNTWALIEQQPGTGVGWGMFNIAWTLTPLPDRPVALFGHAHNLPLHLMAELGAPLGLAACAALLGLLVLAARRTWTDQHRDTTDDAAARRGSLVMLGIVGLHSLLEYPLWYAYLGLPALLALAVCLGWDRPWKRAARWQALLLMAGGAVVLVVSAWAFANYQWVRAIYDPAPGAGSLSSRIEQGQGLTWFADQAHYAKATTFKPVPGQAWDAPTTRAFERAPHVLLDPRLMMAWADALAARDGADDRDQARHLAARLREFNPPAAREWLAACDDPQTPAQRRFVCEAPQKAWNWRDFGLR